MWFWLTTAGCAPAGGDLPPAPDPGQAAVSLASAWPDDDRDGFDSQSDCDDGDGSSYPGGIEYCDGRDNDCDGEVDERPVNPSWYYADADGDGYGVGEAVPACEAPEGYGGGVGDCDDANPSAYPGAPETCRTGYDADCDGEVQDACLAIEHAALAVAGSSGSIGAGGDVDGDGYADLLVACWQCSGHVRITPSAVIAAGGVHDEHTEVSATLRDDRYCEDVSTRGARNPVAFPDLDGDGLSELAFNTYDVGCTGGYGCVTIASVASPVVGSELRVLDLDSLVLTIDQGYSGPATSDFQLLGFSASGQPLPSIIVAGERELLAPDLLAGASGPHLYSEFKLGTIAEAQIAGCSGTNYAWGADLDADGLSDLVTPLDASGVCPAALVTRSGVSFTTLGTIDAGDYDYALSAEWTSPGGASASFADIDGDGVVDVLLAAPGWEAGGTVRGRVLAFSANAAIGREEAVPLFALEGAGEARFALAAYFESGAAPRVAVSTDAGLAYFDAQALLGGGTHGEDEALYTLGYERGYAADGGDLDGDGGPDIVIDDGAYYVLPALW